MLHEHAAIVAKVRGRVDELLLAAGSNPERLGWLVVELDKLQVTASAWKAADYEALPGYMKLYLSQKPEVEKRRRLLELERRQEADDARSSSEPA